MRDHVGVESRTLKEIGGKTNLTSRSQLPPIDELEGEPPTVRVDEAARAALLAVDRGSSGRYNVVDDGGSVSNAKARRALGWSPV